MADRTISRTYESPKRIAVPVGTAFGQLTVIQEVEKRGKERAFLLRCNCGVTKIMLMNNLRSGKSTTCGCGQIQIKHGQWRSPTYNSWAKMMDRCNSRSTDPHITKYYQDRGITADPRWHQFENFLADMGERPEGKSLDRIDSNGNYTKENCRWVTSAQQMRNTRRNVLVVVNGKTLCLTDAAREIGVNVLTIRAHATRRGVTHQQAVDHYATRRS